MRSLFVKTSMGGGWGSCRPSPPGAACPRGSPPSRSGRRRRARGFRGCTGRDEGARLPRGVQDPRAGGDLDGLSVDGGRDHGFSAHFHRVEVAGVHADAALDALVLIDHVRLLLLAAHRARGAGLLAGEAAGAGLEIDGVLHEGSADTRRALLMSNVGLVLLPKVGQRGLHRVGRRLAETAERAVGEGLADLLQQGEYPRSCPCPR